MRWLLLVLTVLVGVFTATGQADDKADWQLRGYIKNMQAGLFFNQEGNTTYLQDNLFHNRLQLDGFLSEHWHVRADLRTRLFYGDLVRQTPNYADQVDDVNNDYFDGSVVLFAGHSWVGHTMLDRLYVEYMTGDWEFSLGRQRINWGISNVWNPNDIFNAFAFTDFDYEERPGSDVLRVKRYTGFASSVEVVVRMADQLDETIVAGLWKINTGGYDMQFLGGYVQDSWAIGGGWAGSIKTAGFKGEMTFFVPNEPDSEVRFAATLGLDYAFENGWYTNLGYLYNSNGSTTDGVLNLFDFEPSAQNLYPYRHALFAQASRPITPLFSGSMAIIYSPVRVHPLFINPSCTYSMATNWDLDLIGQLVFNRDGGFTSPLQSAFLRVKYSF